MGERLWGIPSWAIARRYAVATASVGAALWVTQFFGKDHVGLEPFFFAAVMLSAWYGGLRPGLFATALAGLATTYVSMETAPLIGAVGPDDVIRVAVFVAVSVLISGLHNATRGARCRADEARRHAVEAGAAKDHFIAVLSHELRNPLNPALITASMMEHDPLLPASARADAAMIRRNIELEARLIDDLLDINRLSQGKLLLRPEAVDPRQLVDDVVGVCAGDARAKQVRLVVHQTASRPLHVDPVRARQALWNLLKNAVKFTPEGGTVTVETHDDDDVDSHRTGHGFIRFEVRDTGIGIAPDALPKIFRAFEQGGERVTRTFGGLGLGLSIASALAEAHGGTITAASDGPGKGATFALHLPCAAAAAPTDRLASRPPEVAPAGVPDSAATPEPQPYAPLGPDSPRAPHPSPAGRPTGRRILLVDDHPDTTRVLKRLLARAGHDVRTADTLAAASAAAAAASAEPFDLLLCDLHLPDGSGLDLMRQLRAGAPGLRGIALSGYGMPEDVRRSREAGFDRHLIKPVDLEELERAIRETDGAATPTPTAAAAADVPDPAPTAAAAPAT